MEVDNSGLLPHGGEGEGGVNKNGTMDVRGKENGGVGKL